MKRFLILLLILFALIGNAAETLICGICKTKDPDGLYAVKGLSDEEKRVCGKCLRIVPRCTICRLPVSKDGSQKLEDGRIFCESDDKAGIFDPREIERILYETKREMTRVFWKYMTFPETNIQIEVVDARELHRLYRKPYDPVTTDLQGLTRTTILTSPNEPETPSFQHKIFLLSGLPKSRLMATCAHEFAHVWLNENLKPSRRIDGNTVEGFCELVAYQLMDSLGESFEKFVIEANAYSDDQAVTLIEGEKQYGLYKIIQWMLHSKDRRISQTDLDRIRTVEAQAAKTKPVPIYSISALPTKLELKGISGTGQRKFALINNKTVAPHEKARIQLVSTNITIRCLEIRDRSVVIEINGQEKQELFLPTAK